MRDELRPVKPTPKRHYLTRGIIFSLVFHVALIWLSLRAINFKVENNQSDYVIDVTYVEGSGELKDSLDDQAGGFLGEEDKDSQKPDVNERDRPKKNTPKRKLAKNSLAKEEELQSPVTSLEKSPTPYDLGTNIASRSNFSARIVPASDVPGIKLPHYPQVSRELGEEGRVVVEVKIDRDGSLSDAAIVSSSGFKRLDSAALYALNDSKVSLDQEAFQSLINSSKTRLAFRFDLKE